MAFGGEACKAKLSRNSNVLFGSAVLTTIIAAMQAVRCLLLRKKDGRHGKSITHHGCVTELFVR